MSETLTNANLLETKIAGWNERDFRQNAHYTGNENGGDFTSYLRAYRFEPALPDQALTSSTETAKQLRVGSSQPRLIRPRDSYQERNAMFRPDNELGIEVVCSYDDSARRGFNVVAATTLSVSWLRSEQETWYDIDGADLSEVNLEGDDLVGRTRELSMSHGSYFHFEEHFLAPYIFYHLDRQLDEYSPDQNKDDSPARLLTDEGGNTVAIRYDDDALAISGLFYPASGSSSLKYWAGPGLSMVDLCGGARQAMPDEHPFFNFYVSMDGDELDRGGGVKFSNVDGSTWNQQKISRDFARLVAYLEPVDIL